MSTISTFLFDMDDVICSYDFDGRLQVLENVTGIPALEIKAKIFDSGFEDTADSGAYTASEYLEEASRILGVSIDREEWVSARAQATSPRPEMLSLVKRLGELHETALLTNNGWLMAETLPNMLPDIIDVFGSNVFVSAQIGASKISPMAFKSLLPLLGWQPETTLFVDDHAPYIMSAKEASLQTHLFTDVKTLVSALEDAGVL